LAIHQTRATRSWPASLEAGGIVRRGGAAPVSGVRPNHLEEVHASDCRCASPASSPTSSPSSSGSPRRSASCRGVRPGQGMARLGWAIIGVIVINGIFSFWQEYRAERAIAALRELLPQQVTVARDGSVQQIPAEGLVPGDVVLVAEGDSVPADCRLIDAFGCASTTRRSPASRGPRCGTPAPARTTHRLTATNLLLGRHVRAHGHGSRRGVRDRHAHRVRPASPTSRRPRARRSRRSSARSPGCRGCRLSCDPASASASSWSVRRSAAVLGERPVRDRDHRRQRAGGLLPTVTLSLAMRDPTHGEAQRPRAPPAGGRALGSTTVICCDKTGTLTCNRMAVRSLYLGGEACTPEDLRSQPARAAAYRSLLRNAALCHNLGRDDDNGMSPAARRPDGGGPRHARARDRRSVGGRAADRRDPVRTPTASACRSSARGPTDARCTARARSRPCCALHAGAVGLAHRFRSTTRRAAPCCRPRTRWRSAACACSLRRRRRAGMERRQRGRADAQRHHRPGRPPRPEVPAAIARCTEAGIRVVMVTGDHPHTAQAIAREIGLVRSSSPVVITGRPAAPHAAGRSCSSRSTPPAISVSRARRRRPEDADRRGAGRRRRDRRGDGGRRERRAGRSRPPTSHRMGISGTDVAKAGRRHHPARTTISRASSRRSRRAARSSTTCASS